MSPRGVASALLLNAERRTALSAGSDPVVGKASQRIICRRRVSARSGATQQRNWLVAFDLCSGLAYGNRCEDIRVEREACRLNRSYDEALKRQMSSASSTNTPVETRRTDIQELL